MGLLLSSLGFVFSLRCTLSELILVRGLLIVLVFGCLLCGFFLVLHYYYMEK